MRNDDKLFKENMKKTFLLFCFFISLCIYGEENTNNRESYEFGIKFQKITFVPYEYKSIYSRLIEPKSSLKNNDDLIFPAFFKYRNFDKKFGIDIDLQTLKTNNLTYDSIDTMPSGSFYYQNRLGSVRRDDFNVNFLYLPFNSNPQILHFGLGIKKIDREFTTENLNSSGIYYDKINTHGLSIPIKSNINIFENFDINLAFDPYITLGSRKYIKQNIFTSYYDNAQYPFIIYSYTNPNAIAQILGFQIDVSFSYRFFDRFKFYFGLNRNHSEIKFIHSNEANYRYFDGTKTLLYFPETQDRRFDSINSIYFGISTIL